MVAKLLFDYIVVSMSVSLLISLSYIYIYIYVRGMGWGQYPSLDLLEKNTHKRLAYSGS